MLAVIGTASIVFYAAAAALALIYAVVFFVALLRKKHRRNAFDVILIILGVIVMLAALCAGAFAAVNMYKPFGVSVADESGALNLFYNEKKIFGVPKIGLLIGFFDEFALIGVIVPFALLFLCLVSVITLGVKTRKRKKIKDKPEDLQIRADEPTAENSEFVEDELQEEKPSQETKTEQEENTLDGEPTEFETESEEELEPTEEEMPPLEEDGLPPADDTGVADENVLNIFDEINKLVPGAEEGGEGASIDDELKKAIEEGYALSDTLSRPADFGFEENSGEYPFIEDEEPEEDSAKVEDTGSEEQEEEEESTDGWAYDETEEEPENSYATEEEEPPMPEEQSPAPTPKPQRKVTHIESSELPAARVRTIIRRPTAKSIEDIEKRAESILEHSETARENAAAKRAEESVKKPTAQKSKTQSAPKRKPTAKKSKPQTETKAEYKPEEDVKPVEARSGGLPLTRKYIILNRRSAATIFNEYLNSKRESEKEELKGSLNTIIMK